MEELVLFWLVAFEYHVVHEPSQNFLWIHRQFTPSPTTKTPRHGLALCGFIEWQAAGGVSIRIISCVCCCSLRRHASCARRDNCGRALWWRANFEISAFRSMYANRKYSAECFALSVPLRIYMSVYTYAYVIMKFQISGRCRYFLVCSSISTLYDEHEHTCMYY